MSQPTTPDSSSPAPVIVARRVLYGPEGTEYNITLEQPMREPAGEWRCRAHIDSAGGPRDSVHMFGADSMQALLLCLKLLQRRLNDAYPGVEMSRERPSRAGRGHGIPRFVDSLWPDVREAVGSEMDRLDRVAIDEALAGKRRWFQRPREG